MTDFRYWHPVTKEVVTVKAHAVFGVWAVVRIDGNVTVSHAPSGCNVATFGQSWNEAAVEPIAQYMAFRWPDFNAQAPQACDPDAMAAFQWDNAGDFKAFGNALRRGEVDWRDEITSHLARAIDAGQMKAARAVLAFGREFGVMPERAE